MPTQQADLSQQHNTVASLNIHGANNFDRRTRVRIVKWLIEQAVFLEGCDPSEIASRYRARFLMTKAAKKPKPKKKKVVNKKKAKYS